MNIKRIISSIGIGAGAVILGLGMQYALANWSAPLSAPPTCNTGNPGCDAPINVGSNYQAKAGGLTLGSNVATTTVPLDVEGVGYAQALIVGKNIAKTFQYLDGSQGTGKILASDANGDASWVSTSSLGITGGGGSNTIVYITPVTVANVNTTGTWTTVSLSGDGLPSGVSTVILATTIDAANAQSDVAINMRANSSDPTYELAGTVTNGGGGPSASAFNQGFYPISSAKTFDYYADGGTGGTIVLVGYVVGTGPMSTVYVGGVTSITAGGNMIVSGSGGNGTGNVTLSTTPTQSTGTVGGGCYLSTYYYIRGVSATYTGWGNGTGGSNCTCPSGYTVKKISQAFDTFNNVTYPTGYSCLLN